MKILNWFKIKFSQLILEGTIWRLVWRSCLWEIWPTYRFSSVTYPLEFLWLLINWYRLCSDVMSYEMYARNNSFWGFLCIRDARLRGNKITDNLKETPFNMFNYSGHSCMKMKWKHGFWLETPAANILAFTARGTEYQVSFDPLINSPYVYSWTKGEFVMRSRVTWSYFVNCIVS